MNCFFFSLFVRCKDFLYSVHEYSDIIYSRKRHIFDRVNLFAFSRVKKRQNKTKRLENISRMYKDSAVLESPVLSVNEQCCSRRPTKHKLHIQEEKKS